VADNQVDSVNPVVQSGNGPDDVEGHSLMEEVARDAARDRARDADRWSRQERLARSAPGRPGVRQRVGRLLRGG
jgi:hypothetical protein